MKWILSILVALTAHGQVILDPWTLFPQSASFTPTDIGGLQLWLDASDANTLYDATSGGSLVAADGAVARWEDKSGGANHVTNNVAGDRALRKTSIANGRDVLRFDGTSDFYYGPNLGLNTVTVFAVARTTTTSGTRNVMRDGLTLGSSFVYVLRMNSGTNNFVPSNGTNNVSVLNGALGTNNFNVMTGVQTTTNATVIFNNNTPVSASFTGSLFNGGFRMRIGAGYVSESDTASADSFWSGDMAEILIYNSALTSAQITQVSDYLKTKWGTP